MTTMAQAMTAAWMARHVPNTGTRSSGLSSGAVSGIAGTGQRPGQPLCDNLAVITGFNTDVKYKGLVYHVQTEDKGSVNPLIETLIYKGGEILASRRLPYAELVRDTNTEAAISRLMEEQHKAMILEVKRGRFAPPQQEEVAEDLSLDEIVLAYLAARATARPA
jgi:hypothetical protein